MPKSVPQAGDEITDPAQLPGLAIVDGAVATAPRLLPGAVEMLRELRRELATTLAGVAGIPTVRPLRTYRREQDDYETRIWHDGEVLCVLTCHGSSMGPTLHIAAQAGRNGWPHLQTMPDWTCLGADEAFEIAGALLGAALAVAPSPSSTEKGA